MNPYKLEQDLDKLGQTLAPGPSIVPDVMSRVRGLPMQAFHPNQHSRWLMRGTIGLAACAAVVFLVTTMAGRRIALADVLEKIKQTHTLTFDDEKNKKVDAHVYCKGDYIRIELTDSQFVDIWDRSTGKMLSLEAAPKRATLMNLACQPFDFYAWLKDLKDGKEERLGEKELNGQKCEVFKVTRSSPFSQGKETSVTITLWVEPATGLPVQMQATVDGHDETLEHIKFDEPIADSLFDMTIPAGYKVLDLGGITSEQLKPIPTTQQAVDTLTLRPGVGIGSLKFGDTREKVIQVLGQPEEVRQGMDLGYPSKGLFVLVMPNGGLLNIVAMSKKSAGPFAMNDFPGKTDKGIGIGATRAQIEAAYGNAAKVTHANETTVGLEYSELKISFTLYDDQLVQMSIRH